MILTYFTRRRPNVKTTNMLMSIKGKNGIFSFIQTNIHSYEQQLFTTLCYTTQLNTTLTNHTVFTNYITVKTKNMKRDRGK